MFIVEGAWRYKYIYIHTVCITHEDRLRGDQGDVFLSSMVGIFALGEAYGT